MSMVTVTAPANIAFIKYWGNSKNNLPLNPSISMTLSSCVTTTTVSSAEKEEDLIFIENEGGEVSELKKDSIKNIKAYEQIERVKNIAGFKGFLTVSSKNSFPSMAGIASSASGFCALTSGVVLFTGLNNIFNDKKELSKLVRLSGSASASRSVHNGFVELKTGKSEDESFAVEIAPPDHWSLCDVIAVVSSKSKKTPSSEGHLLALTSPYLKTRIHEMQKRIGLVREAILNRDLEKIGICAEQDTISMHAVMMTSIPPLYYFTEGTMSVIHQVFKLRSSGLAVYFSIDAGANVHLICEKKDEKKVVEEFSRNEFVEKTIVNYPCPGVCQL